MKKTLNDFLSESVKNSDLVELLGRKYKLLFKSEWVFVPVNSGNTLYISFTPFQFHNEEMWITSNQLVEKQEGAKVPKKVISNSMPKWKFEPTKDNFKAVSITIDRLAEKDSTPKEIVSELTKLRDIIVY